MKISTNFFPQYFSPKILRYYNMEGKCCMFSKNRYYNTTSVSFDFPIVLFYVSIGIYWFVWLFLVIRSTITYTYQFVVLCVNNRKIWNMQNAEKEIEILLLIFNSQFNAKMPIYCYFALVINKNRIGKYDKYYTVVFFTIKFSLSI